MCKTTTDTSSNISNGLLKIPVACPTGTGGDEVSILVFDPDHLSNNVTESVDAWRQSLELFFKQLKSMNGLPDEASQALQPFIFKIVYHDRNSTPEERNGFGMMDFPVYLVEGEGGFTNPMRLSEGIALLEAHKLPEKSFTFIINEEFGGPVVAGIVDIKKNLKSFIQLGSDEIALGLGVPGTYLPKSQYKCRKLGLIKVNEIVGNIASEEFRRNKFLRVLKHELGHMLGLEHMPNTIMDESYTEVDNHELYTIDQVRIIAKILSDLKQS